MELPVTGPPERSPSPSRISVAGGDTTQYGTAARAWNQVRSRPPLVRGARHLPVRRVRAHRGRRVPRSSEGRLPPARAVGAAALLTPHLSTQVVDKELALAIVIRGVSEAQLNVHALLRARGAQRAPADGTCAGGGVLSVQIGLQRGDEATPQRSSALVQRLMSLPDVLASHPFQVRQSPSRLGVAAPSALSERCPRP